MIYTQFLRNFLIGLLVTGFASVAAADPLEFSHPYAVATVPGQNVGAAYITITNTGDKPDRLLSASTPVAQSIELHSTMTMNGMSHMQHEMGFDIPAHGKLELAPGSKHMMLMGIKGPLKAGQNVSLKLKFKGLGEKTVVFPVQPAGGNQGMGSMNMKHDGM